MGLTRGQVMMCIFAYRYAAERNSYVRTMVFEEIFNNIKDFTEFDLDDILEESKYARKEAELLEEYGETDRADLDKIIRYIEKKKQELKHED